MGKVVALPFADRRVGDPEYGCVHCWEMPDGGYEIGHESRSGNSWGSFEQYQHPEQAIAAARRLARLYGGCEVAISKPVLEALGAYSVGPELPPRDRGEF